MKALILAAGRGERMRPLTDRTPKPLLPVHGKPLIEWHLQALARAGVREVVVNTAWLEAQFPAALGHGERWGLSITYSMEGQDHGGALETAGGIAKALPLLGDAFWVVSGDIFAPEFPFAAADAQAFAAGNELAELWFVPNPAWHPEGDFMLDDAGRVGRGDGHRLTYANLALFRASLFTGIAPGTRLPLRPKFEEAIDRGGLRGRRWDGRWANLGTPAQLEALEARES